MHHAFHRFVATALALVVTALTAAPSRGDTVYAVSNNDGRVVRYDSTDPAGTVVTLSGTGLITGAAGLAMGPDGNLYIGEAGDGVSIVPSIKRLNLTNNTLSTVHTFLADAVVPAALVFKGNDLLVGRNPFFGNTGAIVKVANATGGVIAVSDYTTGGGLASSPGLAIGTDGALYVSDQAYSFVTQVAVGPVKKFDALGAYVGEVIASGSSGLAGPTGIGIRGNTLYTASIMNGTILQTNLLDNSTTLFGSTGVPFGASPLALLSDGGLLVGSAGGSGLIYQFGGAGTLTGSYSSGLGTIGGLVVAPVPEPATLVTAAIGLAGALAYGRRRSGRQS
jgi:sugar lactone lactonase YvrE